MRGERKQRVDGEQKKQKCCPRRMSRGRGSSCGRRKGKWRITAPDREERAKVWNWGKKEGRARVREREREHKYARKGHKREQNTETEGDGTS